MFSPYFSSLNFLKSFSIFFNISLSKKGNKKTGRQKKASPKKSSLPYMYFFTTTNFSQFLFHFRANFFLSYLKMCICRVFVAGENNSIFLYYRCLSSLLSFLMLNVAVECLFAASIKTAHFFFLPFSAFVSFFCARSIFVLFFHSFNFFRLRRRSFFLFYLSWLGLVIIMFHQKKYVINAQKKMK